MIRTFRALALASLLVASIGMGCEANTNKSSKPTGTPTDPVETCERIADVCRYKSSQLGVCIEAPEGSKTQFVCAPQH